MAARPTDGGFLRSLNLLLEGSTHCGAAGVEHRACCDFSGEEAVLEVPTLFNFLADDRRNFARADQQRVEADKTQPGPRSGAARRTECGRERAPTRLGQTHGLAHAPRTNPEVDPPTTMGGADRRVG
jgi:hypothetical protein